jgi:hypothetical protein
MDLRKQECLLYRGIQSSLSVANEVQCLFVEAGEADDYFYWPISSAKKLKTQFPNLKKIFIEDDYLVPQAD